MNHPNPTPITVGMNGTFVGRRYRVAGRIVMGMEEAGETYHWNEFNLVGADGVSATLVHEETERGVEWKLFTLFDPQSPMTAAEAATKRLGDPINLDGRTRRVTLVDESRVYAIEGAAPEGVEVGDVAKYFNAGAGNGMLVVSWTGDEIEFYRGLSLPGDAVASAFGLPVGPAFRGRAASSGSIGSSLLASWVVRIFIGIVALIILFAGYSACRAKRSPSKITKPKLAPAPLLVGSASNLRGTTYRIQGHAVVETAQVGQSFDRHEYQLAGENGSQAVLVLGWRPGAKTWLLLTPFQPANPMTPQQAATQRWGEKVNLDGALVPVTELFRSTFRQTESAESADLTNGSVFYGFTAQSGTNLFLARWQEGGITFHRGNVLPPDEVMNSFAPTPRR